MTRRLNVIPIVTAVVGCLFCATHVAGDCPVGITPRLPWVKPPSVLKAGNIPRLTIKFMDDLELRAPVDVYGSLGWKGDPDPRPQEVVDALANLDLVTQGFALTYTQLLKLDPDDLGSMEDLARGWSCFAQPDLAGIVIVEVVDSANLDPAAASLLALPEVEWVYFTNSQPSASQEPPPSPEGEGCVVTCSGPCDPDELALCNCTGDPNLPCAASPFQDCCDISPPTCDYFSQRSNDAGSLILDYHGPNPGIDAICAWAYGARGAGIEIADVESSFDPGHEDLCGIAEPQSGTVPYGGHGTEVLGIMVARDNGYGWTGLAPEADASFFTRSPVGDEPIRRTALAQAIAHVDVGDVIVIEIQSGGAIVFEPLPLAANGAPMEVDPWFWLLTRLAADTGAVVVAAAGNTHTNMDCKGPGTCTPGPGPLLDYTYYHARNDSTGRDSGAIIVGAGTPDLAHHHQVGTIGERVNLQGWGRDIFTTGALQAPVWVIFGQDGRQNYRPEFSGTSGATPFVGSAAALIQSLILPFSLTDPEACKVLTSEEMRILLIETGVDSGDGWGGHNTPLPDLAAAIWELGEANTIDMGGGPPTGLRPNCLGLQDLVQDCNGNLFPDRGDITHGTSNDCNGNWIPDECEINPGGGATGGPFFCDPASPPLGLSACDIDCNKSGIPDACDVPAGISSDCNANDVLDECEIDQNTTGFPPGTFFCDPASLPPGLSACALDCQPNGIPDACDLEQCTVGPDCADCNTNGIPDGCDVDNCGTEGWCIDLNGNRIPDTCVALRTPAYPHDQRKNRYISFAPMIDVTPSETPVPPLAFEVQLVSMKRCEEDHAKACASAADCTTDCEELVNPQNPPVLGWVSEPFDPSCQEGTGVDPCPGDTCDGEVYLARVVDTPVYRDIWPEITVQITDCEIIPVATYNIRATTDGTTAVSEFTVGTILKPNTGIHYGDTVGAFVGEAYTPPQRVVNVSDYQAVLLAMQGSSAAPDRTWLDLHGYGEPRMVCSGTQSPCSPAPACPEGETCSGGLCSISQDGCSDLPACPAGESCDAVTIPNGVPPNMFINIADLQRVKFGYQGQRYTDAPDQLAPELCPPNPEPRRCDAPDGVAGGPVTTFTLVADTEFIDPEQPVNIDVYIDDVTYLGAYEVKLKVSGGSAGDLLLKAITVDKNRPDYVFATASIHEAKNVGQARVGVALETDGVSTQGLKYLTTFSYLAVAGATGAFEVAVQEGGATFLNDELGGRLAIQPGECEIIGVGIDCLDDGDCDDLNDCTVDTCTAGNECTYENAPVGTGCDDGLFCTAIDACDVNGVCVGSGDKCPGFKNPDCCESDDRCYTAGNPPVYCD